MSPRPTFAPDQLLPALREYLIAQGLVRKPSVAGDANPMWVDPRRGIPYPGQKGQGPNENDNNLILALYPATGVPSAPFEGFLVRLGAAIWYRGKTSPIVHTKHEQIRSVLHDKRDIDMNGLLVNQAQMTREIQRLGSDERGYMYNCEYIFDMYATSYDY